MQRIFVVKISHALQPRQGEGIAHLTMSRRPQRQTKALKHHVVPYSMSSVSGVKICDFERMGCNRPSSHMPRLQLMAFLCSRALALSPTEAAFA